MFYRTIINATNLTKILVKKYFIKKILFKKIISNKNKSFILKFFKRLKKSLNI